MADEKMKILHLMQILLEETDPEHRMNAEQLMERLKERYGHTYNRKTIYTDIEKLRAFGLKIGQAKGNSFGYFIKERDFTLPELKLLVDSVQASKFITKGKSEELIKKLEHLTGRENARELERQVFIYNRIKADNDSIYKNVDAIHAAIRDNRQIRFKYCEWTVKKELMRRRGGADYLISPWALTWNDENYYLVAYSAEHDDIRHYRVDKMQEIGVTEEPRLGREQFQGFDLASYARKTFRMYRGEDRKITLEGKMSLVGVVIDRFGTDIAMRPSGQDRFRATVTVMLSPQFFGWLAGLGPEMRIVWPEDVREDYRKYLETIIENSRAGSAPL